jgi:hypothetical protein
MQAYNYTPYISGSYPIDSDLQFGFESELFRLEPAFEYYEIDPHLGLPSASTPEGQSLALKAFCKSLPHGDKRKVMRKRQGPDFLPETLHRDDTSNVELVMGPEGSLPAFLSQMQWVNEKIGVGSLQAMVSLPLEKFFGPNPAEGAKAHLGWLNFFNELDVLERIELGRERLAKEPGKGPVRSFLHPYLGPMTAVRHRLLRKFIRENAVGNMFDEENIIRPARRDQSFKFVGSTAYRPDIAGPSRICFEIRDAHRDPELLKNRLARVIFYWAKDISAFRKFADLPPFDSAAAFELLPEQVKAWLAEICPNRAPEAVKAFEIPRFTYEVFRNFAYPLRDWSPWQEAIGFGGEKIQAAQAAYVSRLAAAAGTPGEKGLLRAQEALVAFGAESGLYGAFRAKEDELAGGSL